MIHTSIRECIGRTPMVYLDALFPAPGPRVIAKLEFLNPGGSIKDRPARLIIEQGLRDGTITLRTHLIESTSGNLGIALAMIARTYGLAFTAVIDPKISRTNLAILRTLGATIDMVTEKDAHAGYLQTRLARVQELLALVPDSLWINQYANPLNCQAHYEGTGEEIIKDLDGPLDTLVVAVSTSGTIMGVTSRLRREFPRLRVIAVDAVGSVIFGTRAGPREIPGIGASRRPELLTTTDIDEVVLVDDYEASYGCRELVRREGIFAGGSSGSVVSALLKLLPTFAPGERVVTLLPDRGERYLDLVYDEVWLAQLGPAPAVAIKPLSDETHLILKPAIHT